MNKLLENSLEWNPQLFRELKGRLKPRNLWIAAPLSFVGQFLLFLAFKSNLPNLKVTETFNRYCLGSPPPNWQGYHQPNAYIPDNYCLKDLLGHWMLNWQLWWLDLFLTLSLIGIFALLVVGTYLLGADLSQEEQRGTLNFIRLSPQSAGTILLGKILGVPSLLYFVALLALPLHLWAGMWAGIPLSLILAFYGVLVASCAFFYSAALLFALSAASLLRYIGGGLGGFGGLSTWAASSTIGFFLLIVTILVMSGDFVTHTPFDWVGFFYPGTILSYLVEATFLPPKTVGTFDGKQLAEVLWYGQPLWRNAGSGIGFVLLNYGLWAYWMGQGLKRRFRNPTATLFSKRQSYWISATFAVLSGGFVLQTGVPHRLFENFAILQAFLLAFFLIAIAALSPHRQALQDWARYRHQMSQNRRSLIQDLMLGEKSPSTLAILINLAIFTAYFLPAILLFPLNEYRLPVLASLFLVGNVILLYALVAQQILLLKTPNRGLLAAAAIGSSMILPLACFGLLGVLPDTAPWLWFFTPLPIVATKTASATAIVFSLLGQWLAISGLSFQMTRQLQKAGASATKVLFQYCSDKPTG